MVSRYLLYMCSSAKDIIAILSSENRIARNMIFGVNASALHISDYKLHFLIFTLHLYVIFIWIDCNLYLHLSIFEICSREYGLWNEPLCSFCACSLDLSSLFHEFSGWVLLHWEILSVTLMPAKKLHVSFLFFIVIFGLFVCTLAGKKMLETTPCSSLLQDVWAAGTVMTDKSHEREDEYLLGDSSLKNGLLKKQ